MQRRLSCLLMGKAELCRIHTCIVFTKSSIPLDSEKRDIDCHVAEASLADCILRRIVDYGGTGWMTDSLHPVVFFLQSYSLVINSSSPLPLAADCQSPTECPTANQLPVIFN